MESFGREFPLPPSSVRGFTHASVYATSSFTHCLVMLCRGTFQTVDPLPRCFWLVCFHCLWARLSWRTCQGDGGLEQKQWGRSSRGHSGGQAGGTPGPERALGAGRAVLWRKGWRRAPPEVHPYSDHGVHLPHLLYLLSEPTTLLPRGTSGGSPFQKWADIKKFVFGKFRGRHCPEWR